MQAASASRTAVSAALGRGQHRLMHAPPWVFDDPYALCLIGPSWRDHFAALQSVLPYEVLERAAAFMAARSRFAEDELAAGPYEQYVILGAGLDSFAWRRPDALGPLTVFEVDHPATQELKQERLEALALPDGGAHHVFAPVDFETQTLSEGLKQAGFDWNRPTLFSWLGVVPYLTPEAIEATLRTVAATAPGSAVVISYLVPEPYWDAAGAHFYAVFSKVAEQAGEPVLTHLAPEQAAALLTEVGLETTAVLDTDAIVARYFAERTDGLRPYSVEHLVTARVPSA